MKQNDEPIGLFLSRREAMMLLGASGAAWLMGDNLSQAAAGSSRAVCVVRPEQTEGPYFVDERLHRSDIRSDPGDGVVRSGTPLALTFQVSRFDAAGCRPLPGAQVDIWHCDALGIYSDVSDPDFN